MTTLLTQDVGKLFIPELSAVRFLPGSSAPRRAGHMALVTYAVRDGKTGKKTQAAFAAGLVTTEGLVDRWQNSEELRRAYPTYDAFIAEFSRKLRFGITHNERVNNGGAMVSKSFWGSTAVPNNATVNPPTHMALSKTNGFAVAATNQSIGTDTGNSVANEWVTADGNGLQRTLSITPTGLVAQSGLDNQFTLTIVNTFIDGTAPSTVYGAALFDNTVPASNMYCVASFTSATLQISDTLAVTWSVKD